MKRNIDVRLKLRFEDFLAGFGMEQYRFEEKATIKYVVSRFTDDELDILLGYLLVKASPSPMFTQKFRETYSVALRRVNR